MFLIKKFAFLDPYQSVLQFLLDYLCIMGLCVFIVQYIKKLINDLSNAKDIIVHFLIYFY